MKGFLRLGIRLLSALLAGLACAADSVSVDGQAAAESPLVLLVQTANAGAFDWAAALARRGAVVDTLRIEGGRSLDRDTEACRAAVKALLARASDEKCVFVVGATSGVMWALWDLGLEFGRGKIAGMALLAGGDERFSTAESSRYRPGADMPDFLLSHRVGEWPTPLDSTKNFESTARNAGIHVETDYDFGAASPGANARDAARESRLWRFIEERSGANRLRIVGMVRTRSSREISSRSTVSVGFEGLDRHLFDPEACYDKLAETGVKRARVQTGWSLCEPRRGVYDFSELDGVVSNLTIRGIEPWLMVGFGNTNWMGACYSPAAVGCVPLYYGPACRAAWERFVAAVAERYGSKVRYWEIWNEPDIIHFWQPQRPNPRDYAELLRLTAGIIRERVPNARIGGVCSTVINDWLRQAIPLAAKDVDFWTLHAYSIRPEDARGAQRDPAGKTWDFIGQIAAVRRLFVAAGRPDVEIWQGEAGFPSWFKRDHWLLGKNAEGYGCEEWQAKWLLRRFLTDRRAGCASTSFYACADICRSYAMATTTQAHPAEHGLLDSRRGYARKASHRAMSVYNALLAEADFVSSVRQGDVIVDTYLKDGHRRLVYYRPDDVRQNDRRATRWDGAGLLPAGGYVVSLLDGRAYAHEEFVPLHDYPFLLLEEGDVESISLTKSPGTDVCTSLWIVEQSAALFCEGFNYGKILPCVGYLQVF